MKTVICDMCGKPIKMKKGEIFRIEISKITDGFDTYPHDTSEDIIIDKDYCKKCLNKIYFLLGYRKKKNE
jgi:hypothetical protein